MEARYDWNRIAIEPEEHDCDCEFCDRKGEPDGEWIYPILVKMTACGVEYVTDRFMAVRADLAPIPDNWPGESIALDTMAKDDGFVTWAATDETPPEGTDFKGEIWDLLKQTGWGVRRLDCPPGTDDRNQRAFALFDVDTEEVVGWAMARPTA